MTMKRRDVLRLAGVASAALLVGCDPGPDFPKRWRRLWAGKPAASIPPCIVRPEQTEGPYFVDERLNRSDIRSDPSDGSIREGVPLQLNFRVSELRDKTCAPLPGAMVDVWHCDALGVYSDVQDFNGLFDTSGKKFLRGFQVTDATGAAQFSTIYPGWYEGRAVHVHFKIRTHPESRRGYEFTSQIYFDEALSAQMFRQAPYAAKGAGWLRNQEDGIFRRDGGDQLMLAVTKTDSGYAGTFEIGLQLA
jgi:protocatechuate 3,4-dioxygenase beta subunit